MFTRTKKKTNDEEHVISEQTNEVLLSSKPVDNSHRTITDATKKVAGTEETKDQYPRDNNKRGRQPKLDVEGNPIP